MKILVYEYFSGGGSENASHSSELLRLGWAMLRACIEDCIAAGHNVYTVVDQRLVDELPEGCIVVSVSPGQWLPAIKKTLSVVEAVLLIAPETGGILATLSAFVESSGKLLLGSSSRAVAIAGDKLATMAALVDHGCRVPATSLWPVDRSKLRTQGPWILKPRSGAGCAGIYLTSAPHAIDLPATQYLIQEYVRGTAASVAMIIGKSNRVVLSVNSQDMSFDPVPRYNGGAIPLVHPMAQVAIECAQRVSDAIAGLRGYVGIDMVLSDDAAYVIEVNPRITFTYCGIRRIVAANLIDVILKAALGHKLDAVPLVGAVRFDGAGRILEEVHSQLFAAQEM
jgi:predicted ATP-grasp superfamily ATP-dependent carboligase